MIELLRERPGITICELAQSMRRSERTAYRWLREVSSSLRMNVFWKDGGYFLHDRPDARRVDLTAQELLALRLSLKSAPFADGSPIRRYAESAWEKIRDASPWETLETAHDLASSRAVNVTALFADLPPGLVETLDQAVDSHHRLRVVYRSQKSNRVNEYTIDPYALAFKRHSWYLVGYCREHGKAIQLKLARFISVADTGVEFEPPEDFSVERYFALSWEAWAGGEPTKVRVWFAPEVARMISETQRHPTQVVTEEPDGGVILEVTVAGVEEIAAWIMGYGKHAIVLEPQHLRDRIIDHARGMLSSQTSEAAVRSPESRPTAVRVQAS